MKKQILLSALLGAIFVVSAIAGDAKIVVQKAVYGVPNDANQSRDVTAEVQAKIGTSDFANFPVSDMTANGDPAYGIVKTLTVEYVMDGKTNTATAGDGDTIKFGAQAGK